MDLEKIKQKALELEKLDDFELNNKVLELKNLGVDFLGCIAFVQTNQEITLSEARTKTLELDCRTQNDKEEIDFYHKLMLSEFKNEK